MTKSLDINDFMKDTLSVELHVSELQLGMYVSRLDCDWLETPFLVQGFVIETLDDIDLLAQYCEHVWVDQKLDHFTADRKVARAALLGKGKPTIHKIPNRENLSRVNKVHQSANTAARGMLDAVRMGATLQAGEVKKTVDACVRNVLADPGIALLVMKMQECADATADHAVNVCVLSVAFGRFLGLGPAQVHNLGACGLLHDVGKVKLPPEILNKQGELSEEEQKLYQQHTVFGRNILSSAKNIYPGAVDVAYAHHERVDGKGYPRAIKSAGISRFARIVALCDAYENLTSARGDNRPLTSTEALKVIMDGRDTLFDAALATHFLKMVGMYPPGTIVELANGCVAIVVAKNYRYQHLPRLLIVLDESKRPAAERVVDLAKTVENKLDNGYLIHAAHVDGTYGIALKNYLAKGLVLQY